MIVKYSDGTIDKIVKTAEELEEEKKKKEKDQESDSKFEHNQS